MKLIKPLIPLLIAAFMTSMMTACRLRKIIKVIIDLQKILSAAVKPRLNFKKRMALYYLSYLRSGYLPPVALNNNIDQTKPEDVIFVDEVKVNEGYNPESVDGKKFRRRSPPWRHCTSQIKKGCP